MWPEVLRFELRQQIRQGLLYVTFFLLALFTFIATTIDAFQAGGSTSNILRNSPFMIVQILGSLSAIVVFLTTAFMANATVRDVEGGTAPLFFSTRLTRFDYLFGRFSGAYLACLLAFSGAVLGLLLGGVMPWVAPEQLGPFQPGAFLFALSVMVLPNLFISGALFFGLATLTRSLMGTYLGLVAFLVASSLSAKLLQDAENEQLAALIDPFGGTAVNMATRYWTVFERNTLIPELAGTLLANRVIWVGIGLVVLALTFARFRFSRVLEGRRKQRKKEILPLASSPGAVELPRVERRFDLGARWRQLGWQIRLECRAIVFSVPFVVILLFAFVNTLFAATNLGVIYDTEIYPVTRVMVENVAVAFIALLAIIGIFYSGELVWRERTLKAHEMMGVLPIPNWIVSTAKLGALLLVMVSVLGVAALTSVGIQIWKGFYDFEPMLYVRMLASESVPFLLIAVLAFAVQALSRNKFVGYFIMMLYLVSDFVLTSLHLEHNLYNYASAPRALYSDMNGFGHSVAPTAWFFTYWSLLALALAVVATLLWRRGTDESWAARLKVARQRFSLVPRLTLTAALLGFALCGAYIFYNTNVLNEYHSREEMLDLQAAYEKQYKEYEDLPLPGITDVYAEVDIFPERRRLEIRGRYLLENLQEEPIEQFHLSLNSDLETAELKLPGAELVHHDEDYGYRIYDLKEPLAPGETSSLEFELALQPRGFVNSDPPTRVVGNGTFFDNLRYFPAFGYQEGVELLDPHERRKRGLPPPERAPKLEDMAARRYSALGKDVGWTNFETVISTSADQIAVAPGYLQREWHEGGRRYFHYKMDKPIINFFSFLSARYEVRQGRWEGSEGEGVDIEIYHHPPHDQNVDRMIESVQKSLDYFSTHFSPFQFRQMRILEFPRYASFAQSFANTVPYSESLGFIADLRDVEENIDYVFYVTAHEVAHQWWGHQVLPAGVQGASFLAETLSQYSALMVMEKEHGPEKMRRFLRYELNRYLRARGRELIEEMPLMRVENQQHIHYNKGSLAMYALRDYMGEEALNRALAAFAAETGFSEPPYPTSEALMRHLRREAPPELDGLIEDLFETITLWDSRVQEASYRELPDGRYEVELTLETRKIRADGEGHESEVPLDQWIDVGVFARQEMDGEQEEKVLYLEKHRFSEPVTAVRLVVESLPREVGVDPFNKLIDRNPDDNRKKPKESKEA